MRNDSIPNLFDAAGGAAFFAELTRAFYAHVATDPVLLPMYPADDMDGAAYRLNTFLQQYWGGPTTYSEERGHPRLRMRHAPYPIDSDARDHWLAAMSKALDETAPPAQVRTALWDYFERAAAAMINTSSAGNSGLLSS